jgi:hypothetical protein
MTTIITYTISIQQQINSSFVKGTLNQSSSNFAVVQENNDILTSNNKTLTENHNLLMNISQTLTNMTYGK